MACALMGFPGHTTRYTCGGTQKTTSANPSLFTLSKIWMDSLHKGPIIWKSLSGYFLLTSPGIVMVQPWSTLQPSPVWYHQNMTGFPAQRASNMYISLMAFPPHIPRYSCSAVQKPTSARPSLFTLSRQSIFLIAEPTINKAPTAQNHTQTWGLLQFPAVEPLPLLRPEAPCNKPNPSKIRLSTKISENISYLSVFF